MSKERYVALNGCTFRYRIAGEDNPETIILLHGGRGVGDPLGEWNAYAALADRYRVIAYDQHGCGLSSITYPMNFRQYAKMMLKRFAVISAARTARSSCRAAPSAALSR